MSGIGGFGSGGGGGGNQALDSVLTFGNETLNHDIVLSPGDSLTSSGTVTSSNPPIDLTQTWNNVAANFTGIKLDVNYTASAGAGADELIDLMIGGTSLFRVTGFGQIFCSGTISNYVTGGDMQPARLDLGNTHTIVWQSGGPGSATEDLRIRRIAANNLLIDNGSATADNTALLTLSSATATGVQLRRNAGDGGMLSIYNGNASSFAALQAGTIRGIDTLGNGWAFTPGSGHNTGKDYYFAWVNANGYNGTPDVHLARQNAAGVLGLSQNSSGGAAALRIYNTTDNVTTPANAEWLDIRWDSNVAVIEPNEVGTGVRRPIQISAVGTIVQIGGSSGTQVRFLADGGFGTEIAQAGFKLYSAAAFGWVANATNAHAQTLDTHMLRTAAGGVGIVKDAVGGSASLKVYNITDSTTGPGTNSEYLDLSWTTNVAKIATAKTGTGTVRLLTIEAGSGGVTVQSPNGANYLTVKDTAGNVFLTVPNGDLTARNGIKAGDPAGTSPGWATTSGGAVQQVSYLSWATSGSATRDVQLDRQGAAGVLGLLRDTSGNPAAFRIYNTTDSSNSPTNSEYLGLTWATNTCTIGTAKTGTGTVRDLVLDGATVSVTPQLLIQSGSAGAPGIAFSTHPTTRGIMNDTVNNGVSIVANGAGKLFVGSTLVWVPTGANLQVDDQIRAKNGTGASPSYVFTNNTDRGLFNDTSNNGIGFAVGGSQVATMTGGLLQLLGSMSFQAASNITAVGSFRGAAGSAGTASYGFTANTDRGLFNDTTNNGIGFTVGGSQRAVMTSLVFQLSANMQLDVGSSANVRGTITQTPAGNGQLLEIRHLTENLTLATGSTTTDTTANLLPAGAIILGVTTRVTTTITTAASFSVGDPTTATRFANGLTNLTAGSTDLGLGALQGSVTTNAAGPIQTAAAKVRITTNANPGAGAIRITVHYILLTPATS